MIEAEVRLLEKKRAKLLDEIENITRSMPVKSPITSSLEQEIGLLDRKKHKTLKDIAELMGQITPLKEKIEKSTATLEAIKKDIHKHEGILSALMVEKTKQEASMKEFIDTQMRIFNEYKTHEYKQIEMEKLNIQKDHENINVSILFNNTLKDKYMTALRELMDFESEMRTENSRLIKLDNDIKLKANELVLKNEQAEDYIKRTKTEYDTTHTKVLEVEEVMARLEASANEKARKVSYQMGRLERERAEFEEVKRQAALKEEDIKEREIRVKLREDQVTRNIQLLNKKGIYI